MIKYIDYIKNLINNGSAIIIYDSFRGHLEESVKKKFRNHNFDLAVIPDGLTSICQLLDVTINKPFKDNLHKEWYLWIVEGRAGMTAAGNLRRAKLSNVCGWVKWVWKRISDEMIIESFKTCKISSSLDGSDDETSENDDIGDESEYDIIGDKSGDDIISDDDIGDDDNIDGSDNEKVAEC